MYLFGTDLKKHFTYDFSAQIADKNYAFENIVVTEDFTTVYFMGKAFFKKKRFEPSERRYQYELVRVTKDGHQTQEFNEAGKFSESLKPLLVDDALVAVGFYADRKDNRYNGLVYFKMDARTLALRSKKYNAFSEQFMIDKFGREVDAELKNLIFKMYISLLTTASFLAPRSILYLPERILVKALQKPLRIIITTISSALN